MRFLFINGLTLTLFLMLSMSITGESSRSQASPESASPSNGRACGWVYAAQLSRLSPAQDHAPYALLSAGRVGEAIPGLQRELADHPNSLTAYVGLMQAEPERWQGEISRLEAEIAQQRKNHRELEATDLFKLGTVLYYQREHGPNPPGHPSTDEQEVKARALLAQAWNKDHTPIIGLMLVEMLVTGGQAPISSDKRLTSPAIMQQMTKDLAGSKVVADYLHAQRSDWNADPPAVSLVPAGNLRPFVAVVACLRSLYGQRSGTLQMVDGKPTMVDFPVPPLQLSHERYLKRWYANLVAAEKS